MKLNLGCGSDRRQGWVNVDKYATSAPDQVVDLEQLPWPWPDSAAEEVLLRHVLEHLGTTAAAYLGIMTELWRVCADQAKVVIVVPHPRSDQYLNDPTHVRPITAAGLELFSQARNREWQAKNMPNTPLGLQLGIDFALEQVNMTPDEPWASRYRKGEISASELHQAARQFNNVIAETAITLRAVKRG